MKRRALKLVVLSGFRFLSYASPYSGNFPSVLSVSLMQVRGLPFHSTGYTRAAAIFEETDYVFARQHSSLHKTSPS